MPDQWQSATRQRIPRGILPRIFSAVLPRVRPFTEMGVSGTPVYAGYVLTPERSPRLVGQEKYRTFADIMTNTSIIAAGIRYFLNIVARPQWSMEPADKSDAAKRYADFANDVFLEELHTPWSRVVRRCGMYRFHGFSIQEWTAVKREDGFVGFHDVESRPQWTIWRWEVDERGTVVGAWQRDPLTGRELGLPRGKIMYLVDDTLTDSPEGLGLLRHCVEPADRLKEYLSQESFGFMRDLRGIPVGRAPMDELKRAVVNGQITQQQMDQAIETVKSFASMEKKTKDTAIVLNSQPYISQTDSGNIVTAELKWAVELLQGAAPGLSDMAKAVDRLNTEMARILGVEHLMLGYTAVGSYALAKEKATDLYTMANSVLNDIRLQTQHDLLWPLWSLNGFPDDMMPNLKTEDVAPRDVEMIARVMRDMATAGAIISPDDEAINFVRQLLGAPEVDLDEMAAQMQQQQELQTAQIDAAASKQPKATGIQEDRQDQVDASGKHGQVDAKGNVRKGNGYDEDSEYLLEPWLISKDDNVKPENSARFDSTAQQARSSYSVEDSFVAGRTREEGNDAGNYFSERAATSRGGPDASGFKAQYDDADVMKPTGTIDPHKPKFPLSEEDMRYVKPFRRRGGKKDSRVR